MVIKDWHEEWRISDLNREMLMDKEAEAGKEQTPIGDKTAPKKPRTG
jgi:hypothetical protein